MDDQVYIKYFSMEMRKTYPMLCIYVVSDTQYAVTRLIKSVSRVDFESGISKVSRVPSQFRVGSKFDRFSINKPHDTHRKYNLVQVL